MALPLLEIDSLTLRRGDAKLLERASLSVEGGTLHVLCGPNGAGKTTLLRAILGQVPFEGSIRCHWRRSGGIGYVPQWLDFDRELPMTARDFLALSRQRRPVCLGVGRGARDCGEEALRRVGMTDRADRRLGVLSGGELQRVLLARAIDPVPELLLLDEPVAAVDEEGHRALEEILLRLKKDHGVTALIVSHQLKRLQRIADRLSVLTDRQVMNLARAESDL